MSTHYEIDNARRVWGRVLNEALCATILPARRVLDVGCGVGWLGAFLKERDGSHVTGITLNAAEAEEARHALDHVIVGDVERGDLDLGGRPFDAVILSHVLEHMVDPWSVLRRMADHVTPDGRVYVALPNALVFENRVRLSLGDCRYRDGTVMDSTHLRWFDFRGAQTLVRNAGLRIERAFADGHVPQPLVRRALPGLCRRLDQAGCRLWPGLFGDQFIVVGRHHAAAGA